jgi:hypothetical protein
VGTVRRLPGHLPDRRPGREQGTHPPERISFPHALAAATDTVTAFPPNQADLALATFLLKILMPGFFTRDRPDRASPWKPKEAGDFPARKPGEPNVTSVKRKLELHLLTPPLLSCPPPAGLSHQAAVSCNGPG